MSESWQEFAKRQSDYAVKLERELTTAERERDEARREVARLHEEAKERLEQWSGVYESARHRAERMEQERDQFASMLHDCENERDGWKHRAERAERDGFRVDWLQTLEERLTSIEIEHVGGEFWISEMCDDGATCLKTWRGVTIREAFDRALDAEAQP